MCETKPILLIPHITDRGMQHVDSMPAALRQVERRLFTQGRATFLHCHLFPRLACIIIGTKCHAVDPFPGSHRYWRRRTCDWVADDCERCSPIARARQVSRDTGKKSNSLPYFEQVLIESKASAMAIANAVGPILGGVLASQSPQSWSVLQRIDD